MNKRIYGTTAIDTLRIDLPLEKIAPGYIISHSGDSWFEEKLITTIRKNYLKTAKWFRDSLPSKIAEETYQIIGIKKNKTLLYRNKYHRPDPSTKHHNDLVKKLQETDIKSPFTQ